MEELFRQQPGVIDTETGYTGGTSSEPTYQSHPGDAEALRIEYDPAQTDYRHLLDFFFRIHNPTTRDQQGNDVGTAYRSAIFYANDEERQGAEQFIALVNASGRWPSPVVTKLERLATFHPAEPMHQDYLQKYPDGYTCHYVRFPTYLS
jgi:peptide-methionine (S)-S-oxide reductase